MWWIISALLVSWLNLMGAGGVEAQTMELQPQWSYQTLGPIAIATISDDGSYIVASGYDNSIRLFSRASNTPLWSHGFWAPTLAFISGDGNYIAVTLENYLYFFGRTSSTPLWSKYLGAEPYPFPAISRYGSYVAVEGSYDIYLYTSGGSLLWKYHSSDRINSIALSADGNYLVAGTGSKVYLFHISDNVPDWSYTTEKSVFLVDISSDGYYFVATAGGKVYFFDRTWSYPCWTYQTGGAYPQAFAAISSDGNYVAVSAMYENRAYLFSHTSGMPLWSAQVENPFWASISHTGDYMAVGGGGPAGGRLYLFSRTSSTPIGTYQTTLQNSLLLPFISSNGNYIAVGEGIMTYPYPPTARANVRLFSTNVPPTLTSGSVAPNSGTTGTTFTYEVTYTDANGDPPSYVRVYIDGSPHSMSRVGGTYTDGATYRYTLSLPKGSHTYHFGASDGTYTVRLPTTGAYSGPSVIFEVTLTFRKPDGSPLANIGIYYRYSETGPKYWLGTTDSYGGITTREDLGGRTVYFESSDERYRGSIYIGSGGGNVSASLGEVAGFPWAIIAAVLIVCGVAGGLTLAWQKGLLAPKPKRPKRIEKVRPMVRKPVGKFCTHCELELPADALFCPECGAKLKR